MRTVIHKQSVTNETIDKICDRYVACGWIEIDLDGFQNNVQSVTFQWTGDGIPTYPNINDLL